MRALAGCLAGLIPLFVYGAATCLADRSTAAMAACVASNALAAAAGGSNFVAGELPSTCPSSTPSMPLAPVLSSSEATCGTVAHEARQEETAPPTATANPRLPFGALACSDNCRLHAPSLAPSALIAPPS